MASHRQLVGLALRQQHVANILVIGFKEFSPYFALDGSCPDELRQQVLTDCVQRLKTATRHYARQQQAWIRRFTQQCGIQVYAASVTDPDGSCALVHAFLYDLPIPTPTLSSHDTALTHVDIDSWQRLVCDVCNRTLNGTVEWTCHLKSRAHRKRQAKLRRLQQHDTEQR